MILWHIKTRTGIILIVGLIIGWTCLVFFSQLLSTVNVLISSKENTFSAKKLIRLQFLRRQQRSYDTCVEEDKGVVDFVMLYTPKYMAYCSVAKVGSTFWRRVMLYLHNDTNGKEVNNPFEIPRLFTHYGPHLKSKKVPFDMQSRAPLRNMTRFMFVRDPYSRLWSAYLDKFFLPDFWQTFAKNVVDMRKEPQSFRTRLCSHDVTFNEFLAYIVDFKDQPEVHNEHWRPIQYLCNPCEFRPHLIGKQETFINDVRYILKYFGVEDILKSYDHDKHVEEELTMLINYNYQRVKSKRYYGCITEKELALRLWTVFEFNGYLPFGSSEILNAENVTIESFISLVIKTYRANPNTPTEWKQQRRDTMIDAYKSVPIEIIKHIQELFRMDFLHFDYDPNPPK